MHTQEELATKTRDDLVAISDKLGIRVHHLAKPETIIQNIMQQPQAYVVDAMKHPAEAPTPPMHQNTPEKVLKAIEQYTAKEGFIAKFPEDGTWYFEYKGASDSGNLSIPLRVIVQKAEFVSYGRRQIRSLGRVIGDDKYTGNILAG